MTITEYAATTARALMAAEIAMASVNCGATNVTRAQAKKLLDDYFARVEQAIPWTGPESEHHNRQESDRQDEGICEDGLIVMPLLQRGWRLTERSPDEAR